MVQNGRRHRGARIYERFVIFCHFSVARWRTNSLLSIFSGAFLCPLAYADRWQLVSDLRLDQKQVASGHASLFLASNVVL